MVVPGPDNPGDPIQYDTNLLITNMAAMQVNVDTIEAEVIEVEKHLHSPERWLGLNGAPTATVFADANETSYQIDSGNTVFGSWVQILGTDDTPVVAGKA